MSLRSRFILAFHLKSNCLEAQSTFRSAHRLKSRSREDHRLDCEPNNQVIMKLIHRLWMGPTVHALSNPQVNLFLSWFETPASNQILQANTPLHRGAGDRLQCILTPRYTFASLSMCGTHNLWLKQTSRTRILSKSALLFTTSEGIVHCLRNAPTESHEHCLRCSSSKHV